MCHEPEGCMSCNALGARCAQHLPNSCTDLDTGTRTTPCSGRKHMVLAAPCSSLPTAQLLPLLRLATAGAAEDVRATARDLLASRLRATGMFEDSPWEPGLWLAALPSQRADQGRLADDTTCAGPGIFMGA